MEDIHLLVRAGHLVEVTDSKSGEDLTAPRSDANPPGPRCLKLAIFPVELLHQVIRASGPLLREFVEKYFNQAFQAFSQSQQEFERYFRQTLGLEGTPTPLSPWQQMMFGPAALAFRPSNMGNTSTAPSPNDTAELRQQVADLRREVESLRKQLQD